LTGSFEEDFYEFFYGVIVAHPTAIDLFHGKASLYPDFEAFFTYLEGLADLHFRDKDLGLLF